MSELNKYSLKQFFLNNFDAIINAKIWQNVLMRTVALTLCLGFLYFVVSIDLTLYQQLAFGLLSIIVAIKLNNARWKSYGLIALFAISTTALIRYIVWRYNNTLTFNSTLDNFFGTGLFLAETYIILVVLIGYIQTIWPLKREIIALPADIDSWPTVDLFIPTYNEPLSVVKITILAAQSIDWPKNKLNIYLLDDGKRDDFRDFCTEAKVHYMSRDNNEHHKAGNLNLALSKTHGEFVAFFDCDHIPTRAFLQVTMGPFLKDPKLALVQTPHWFYSPDPFERNLNTYGEVPNEGELFYGVVQKGNDLWNASFFCGSCAVIRRAPLMEVGGIAVETVTEDAHTSLKMSRKGYNTAFIGIPLAAGLATESFSRHIGQRIRWARGMAQIFRTDNPMLGRGLTLPQRLCYLNAMLHFFYGLPRIVLLTAPLAYLFFDAAIYNASATMVLVYAFPAVFLSNMTNTVASGHHRHSFWSDVYESCLAWFLLVPVLWALIRPKSGSFNVTTKGGVVEEEYFDWKFALPILILLVLNISGIIVALVKLYFGADAYGTLLLNLFWVSINSMILAAGVNVAMEAKQIRNTPRISSRLPATLILSNGKTIACHTSNFSSAGVGLTLPANCILNEGEQVRVSIVRGDKEALVPGTVCNGGSNVGINFDALTLQQLRDITAVTFSRAEMWLQKTGKSTPKSPFASLSEIFFYSRITFSRAFKNVFMRQRSIAKDVR